MLTFTEEEFEKYLSRRTSEKEAAKLRQSARASHRRDLGAEFERQISAACDLYRETGEADIEKTPEPMRPIRSLGDGKFIAFFEKPAQPDYTGVMRGGISVMFEAKATETDKMHQDRVTETQTRKLQTNAALGGWSFVLCQYASGRVYRIPWQQWAAMKETWGRKYITEEDAAEYAVPLSSSGLPLCLHNAESRKVEKPEAHREPGTQKANTP